MGSTGNRADLDGICWRGFCWDMMASASGQAGTVARAGVGWCGGAGAGPRVSHRVHLRPAGARRVGVGSVTCGGGPLDLCTACPPSLSRTRAHPRGAQPRRRRAPVCRCARSVRAGTRPCIVYRPCDRSAARACRLAGWVLTPVCLCHVWAGIRCGRVASRRKG